MRLYHATFNRASDKEGISFWASNLARGSMTFSEVADQFLKSTEFETQYGSNISNENFVVILYKNVSKREPNETESKALLDLLIGSDSKEKVLLELSESIEYVAAIESEFSVELKEAELAEKVQLDIISQEITTTTIETTSEVINLEEGAYIHTHTYDHTHKGEKEHNHDEGKDKHEGHDHDKDKGKDKHEGHDHDKDKGKDKHDHKDDHKEIQNYFFEEGTATAVPETPVSTEGSIEIVTIGMTSSTEIV